MTLEALDLATFRRNGMLTVDATINGLDGTAANLTGFTGDSIRWAISKSRRGPRLATLSLTANTYGDITLTGAAAGLIRIQFRAPVPPADPDPFAAGLYWQECEVVLAEATETKFFGPVRIEPSMFANEE
jgi:hypothetical protein